MINWELDLGMWLNFPPRPVAFKMASLIEYGASLTVYSTACLSEKRKENPQHGVDSSINHAHI